MDDIRPLPHLSAEEQRVLGSLIEKSVVTPDYYPMTINSLTAACNQRSSRKPVVEYSEDNVINALNSLKAQSLVATAVGASIRAAKYKHNFTTVYPLSDGELAIVCLLLLRGPQTPGELNTNSGRLHEFSSLASVHEALDKLRSGPHPFVKELSRQAGQKETRFTHLLGEVATEMENPSLVEQPVTRSKGDLEARISALEAEVADLKEKLRQVLG